MKTPKEIVTGMFGVRGTARILGLSPGAVSKWDTIPSKHHKPLLAAAKAAKKHLTPTMLVLGAKA